MNLILFGYKHEWISLTYINPKIELLNTRKYYAHCS